jgi:hypothetical protein
MKRNKKGPHNVKKLFLSSLEETPRTRLTGNSQVRGSGADIYRRGEPTWLCPRHDSVPAELTSVSPDRIFVAPRHPSASATRYAVIRPQSTTGSQENSNF